MCKRLFKPSTETDACTFASYGRLLSHAASGSDDATPARNVKAKSTDRRARTEEGFYFSFLISHGESSLRLPL